MKQNQIKTIRENRLKGTLIRSRAKWIEQGEKPTNYFCNLENRHFVSKRMSSLTNKYETELTNELQIEKEVFNFYQNLYTSNEQNITEVDLHNI